MVEQIDRDGSGSIEFPEFVEMMKKKMLEDKNVEVEIEKAFNYFDDDNEVNWRFKFKGAIDLEKLRKVAADLGEECDE